MGRRHRRDERGSQGGEIEVERTLAAAEEEAAWDTATGAQASAAVTRCACGADEFVLEAYMHVVGGQMRPQPVEVESLSCPQCGREYEGILGEGGRILRGDFLGFLDEGDE